MSAVIAPLSFHSRDLYEALEEVKKPKTLLLDTFFKSKKQHTSDNIDFDKRVNTRRMARLGNPHNAATPVVPYGFTANSFKTLYISEKMTYSAADFMNRGYGEVTYSGVTPNARINSQVIRDLAEMRDQIVRREEWMAMKLLTGGTYTVTGDGVNATVTCNDSNWLSTHVTAVTAWTGAATTPLDDIDTMGRQVFKDSGLSADTIVMSSRAWTRFYNNAQVSKIFDTRNFSFGNINGSLEMPSGARYHGNMNGYDLWEYNEYFLDSDSGYPTVGTETDLVTAGHVIVGSSKLRGTRHYGPIQDIEADGNAVQINDPYFINSWIEKDPSVRIVKIQSAPLVLLEQFNGVGVLTGA